jgi:hypothetical protein
LQAGRRESHARKSEHGQRDRKSRATEDELKAKGFFHNEISVHCC